MGQKQAKQTKQAVNVNDNVNVNVNVINKLSSALLLRMKANAGQDFEPSEVMAENVARLIEKGYSKADMLEVADYKWKELQRENAPDMFYNPDFIFGDSFEGSYKMMEEERSEADEERVARDCEPVRTGTTEPSGDGGMRRTDTSDQQMPALSEG